MTDLEFLDAYADHFDSTGNVYLPESLGGKDGNPDVHFCSPPAKNFNALGGPKAANGRGVCTPPKKSNLDKGDLNIVRKGLTVDYMGLRCIVQRVRLGMFYGKTLVSGAPINFPCAWVRVVA